VREIKQKRKIQKILFSWASVAVLVVLLFLIASATWGVFEKFLETRKNMINAEAGVFKLEERKKTLLSEIEHLGTPRGVEEEIRENFGFVKEGEGVVVIVRGSSSSSAERVNDKSVWERLFGIFR
jgi:cell division protein FtsB